MDLIGRVGIRQGPIPKLLPCSPVIYFISHQSEGNRKRELGIRGVGCVVCREAGLFTFLACRTLWLAFSFTFALSVVVEQFVELVDHRLLEILWILDQLPG